MSDIKPASTEIVEYSVTTAELAKLKARFEGVTYDVSTIAGLDVAKVDRRELVTLRTTLEAKRQEIKAPALAQCNLIDSEAKRIKAEIVALETPIDTIIKAEESRKLAEKVERERLAAIAQKVLDDKILEIGKLPIKCVGESAEDITLFLATLEARPFGGEFTGETLTRAEAAKAEAVAEIRTILTRSIEAETAAATQKAEQESEAARLETERIETERLAAIQRESMAAQQAAFDAEKLRHDAEQAELQKKIDADAAQFAREKAAFEAEQTTVLAERAEVERLAQVERDAVAVEAKRVQDAADAAKREEERQAGIAAEIARKKADVDRKAAEKKAKLLAAKCADSATAFQKILDICNDLENLDIRTEIALIAEANL